MTFARAWPRVAATLLAGPIGAAIACETPVIHAPAAESTVGATRPTIAWSPVAGASGYRVVLDSRVQEGERITRLDVTVAEPRLLPPRPLAEHRARVEVIVTARCGAAEGSPSRLEAGGRFFIDTALACPGVGAVSVRRSSGTTELSWPPVSGATSYQVRVFAAADGKVLSSVETASPVASVADHGTPVIASVRARCADGFGAFGHALF